MRGDSAQRRPTMGEYASFNGDRIKIGTCEDMYYLRYDQRFMVLPISGNVDPRSKSEQEQIRFRFPWPDEDKFLPGGNYPDFDPFRRVAIPGISAPAALDHGSIQFRSTDAAGYLVSLPCPEGPNKIEGVTIHRNGWGGAVYVTQNAVRGGMLVPIFQCGGCGYPYRVTDPDDLKHYTEAIDKALESWGPSDARRQFFTAIRERMQIRPA